MENFLNISQTLAIKIITITTRIDALIFKIHYIALQNDHKT